jgi:hypothetical protein
MPIVEQSKQNTPSFLAEVMTGLANWKKPRERMLFILCGAGGLRIGEALGAEIDKHISSDFLTISIRHKARHCKIETRLKTPSAERRGPSSCDCKSLKGIHWGTEIKISVFFAHGKPLSSSNVVRRHLHPALKQLGYINPTSARVKLKSCVPALPQHLPAKQDAMPKRSSQLLDGTRGE